MWLLGYKSCVGKSSDVNDVIGLFGKNTSNASGNRFISLFIQVELVIYNGRKLVSEPEWIRVRPSMGQKSVINRYSACGHKYWSFRPFLSVGRVGKSLKVSEEAQMYDYEVAA